MKNIEKIEQIHPDLISQFLATGECDQIPIELRLFLLQLQWAMEIYQTERNISRAAQKLRLRISAEQKIKIEQRTCMQRIYEAINYFNVDNNVPIRIWEDMYANQFESLAKLCAVAGDYKTQSKCYERALECRRRSSEIAESSRELGLTIMYTPELTPEQLGFNTQSLKKISSKYNDGFYYKLIQDLSIESTEKKRLLREADIDEAQIINELECN